MSQEAAVLRRTIAAAESAKSSAYNASAAMQAMRQENQLLRQEIMRTQQRVASLETRLDQVVAALNRGDD